MNRRRGFNMAEIMVALVVITLALFALVSVNVYSMRGSRGNQQRQTASLIATTRMSQLEAALKLDFRQALTPGRLPASEFPDYQVQVTDQGYENAAQTLRRVKVDVYWQADSQEHDFALVTTFYNY